MKTCALEFPRPRDGSIELNNLNPIDWLSIVISSLFMTYYGYKKSNPFLSFLAFCFLYYKACEKYKVLLKKIL